MIHHKVFNQALNGKDFKSALIEIKDKCTSKGILNPIFLAVNARIHHYSNVEEFIASLQLKVVYLRLRMALCSTHTDLLLSVN